jgi:antitoxin (DNA-binding transcriptional repressor) of toxin-antitoxin stability system
MRLHLPIFLGVILLLFGCGPSKEMREFEDRVSRLVREQATFEVMVREFGEPYHITTREEAVARLTRIDRRDSAHRLTERLTKSPETAHYVLPDKSGDAWIFLNANRRAAGYYFNIQM